MSESWRGWNHLGQIDELQFLYRWRGVYAIRLVDSAKRAIRIGRFLGVNETGMLQIGVSNDVGKRLLAFFRSCYEGRHTHSEGSRLCLIRMVTQYEDRIYPGSSLQFNVKLIADAEQARHEEERLLKSYFRHYGELPPLNIRIEDQRVPWLEMDTVADTLW